MIEVNDEKKNSSRLKIVMVSTEWAYSRERQKINLRHGKADDY